MADETEVTSTPEAPEEAPKALSKEEQRAALENDLEAQREAIKANLKIDDEAFDAIIKDTIIASFLELSIRIRPDDPIFAVLLSQKKVMDYYALLIANALKATPKEIANAVDEKLENISDMAALFGEQLDNENAKYLKNFQDKTIELNNSIIASFDKFIDKKIEELKKAGETLKLTPAATSAGDTERANNKIMWFIVILLLLGNILFSGLTAFIGDKPDRNREVQYQQGLIDGFSQVRKTFNAKDAEKVEKIIVESIDKRLGNQ